MKTCSRFVSFGSVLLLTLGAAWLQRLDAATPREANGLQIAAFALGWDVALRKDKPPRGPRKIKVDIFLTNCGSMPLSVSTGNWTRGEISGKSESGSEFFTAVLDFGMVSLFGVESVPSEYAFAPVKLSPQECYILQIEVTLPEFANPSEMRVRYVVDEKLAATLHLWRGSIEAAVSKTQPEG